MSERRELGNGFDRASSYAGRIAEAARTVPERCSTGFGANFNSRTSRRPSRTDGSERPNGEHSIERSERNENANLNGEG